MRSGARLFVVLDLTDDRAVLAPVLPARGRGAAERGDVGIDAAPGVRAPIARCGALVIATRTDLPVVATVPDVARLRVQAVRAARAVRAEAVR